MVKANHPLDMLGRPQAMIKCMLPVWHFAVFRVINQKKTASDFTKRITYADWRLHDSEINNQFVLSMNLLFVQEQ